MQITYGQNSSPGPRPLNEDYLLHWIPPAADMRRTHGPLAIISDGIGGQDDGEVASKLAAETALKIFLENAPANTSPQSLLRQMFDAANLAVYDASIAKKSAKRMGATLTISIFRNNEVFIGHVGDCRAYLLQNGRARRITTDHSYASTQLKLGLISQQDALNSPLRSVLTRSIGQDPIVRLDFYNVPVNKGDRILQCCDGVYCALTDGELFEIGAKSTPEDAAKALVALAEKRAAQDNLSVQIVQIDDVERLTYYRGVPVYQKIQDAAAGQELQIGQLLDKRFQVTELVSRSGMAAIFKATDLETNQTVAIKVPFMRFESDPSFFSRFQREEDIGKKLSHPYVLRVIPVPENAKSRPYIVMEFLDGQTLGQLMHSVRPLPIPDALRIASCLCEALQYLHENDVVHRDLKPDNVMVCNDGSLRVMDFGIAKVEGVRRLTFGGFTPAMGTPDYMAPEQVKGKRGDQRTDIYSLGAILYEMTTGQTPFEGANPFVIMNARITGDPPAPSSIRKDLSPQVEEIILHAMQRNVADRYPTARNMKHDLDHPNDVQITGLAHKLVSPQPWRSTWRRSRLLILCIAIPVLLVIIFLLLKHVSFH